MALPVNGSTHLITAYYSFYRPRKDERLSWSSWLTCSGWLTHISGHPSAAGRAQDRESSPARDRRSTTEPRHQPFGRCNPISAKTIQLTFKLYYKCSTLFTSGPIIISSEQLVWCSSSIRRCQYEGRRISPISQRQFRLRNFV